MNKRAGLVAIISFVMLLMVTAAFSCGPKQSATTSVPLPPGPQSLSLLSGELTIKSQTNSITAFTVDANMKDVIVKGKFRTTGGFPHTIQAYIMDDATYKLWIKGKTTPVLFDSGQLSSGTIDQPLTTPGKYYLIFTNWYDGVYAETEQVEVSVDVALNWTY